MAIAMDSAGCPTVSDNQYTTVAVTGGGDGRPDNLHGDLNLGLRGYAPVDAAPALIDKNGPVDGDPPQLAGIFADGRLPGFGQSYQVYDWDWDCAGGLGCRSGLLEDVAATLLTLDTAPGEVMGIPHRNAQIYDGGYKALVLYAEETRLTLGYTREDSVANGYAVHIENVCVDPNLLALYRSSNAAGGARCPHCATKRRWASPSWAIFWWQCATAGCFGIPGHGWTGGLGIKGGFQVGGAGLQRIQTRNGYGPPHTLTRVTALVASPIRSLSEAVVVSCLQRKIHPALESVDRQRAQKVVYR